MGDDGCEHWQRSLTILASPARPLHIAVRILPDELWRYWPGLRPCSRRCTTSSIRRISGWLRRRSSGGLSAVRSDADLALVGLAIRMPGRCPVHRLVGASLRG